MSQSSLGVVVFFGAIAVFFFAVTLAARRHAARMRREGKWDENGPLRPTSPDDSYPLKYDPRYGGLYRTWERFNRLRGRKEPPW
jgi:hypothetical protein